MHVPKVVGTVGRTRGASQIKNSLARQVRITAHYASSFGSVIHICSLILQIYVVRFPFELT